MEIWIREIIPCTASSLDRKKVGALTFQSLPQGLELMNPKVSSPSPFRDFPNGPYFQEKYERWSKYLTNQERSQKLQNISEFPWTSACI